MRDEDGLNEEERGFERMLGQVKVVGVESGRRDALLFAAGKRAGKKRVWVWRGMAAVLGVALVVSWVGRLQMGPEQQVAKVTPAAVRVEEKSSFGVEDAGARFSFMGMRSEEGWMLTRSDGEKNGGTKNEGKDEVRELWQIRRLSGDAL